MPTMYRIAPGEIMQNRTELTTTSLQRGSFEVHYSRCLHVADNCLENLVFGHSRFEPVINTLWDLQKVAGGSSETFWLTANRGLHIDVDKDVELDEESASDLSDEVEEYAQQLRR
ncbi:hypothetical protein GP486_008850, partial [Trichoglossum hirsutum]